VVVYRAILDVCRELVGCVAGLRVGRRVALGSPSVGTIANAALVIARFGHGDVA